MPISDVGTNSHFLLQRGRARAGRGMKINHFEYSNFLMLQRGRARAGAEWMLRSWIRRRARLHASAGPRPRGRMKTPPSPPVNPPAWASTGPRPRGRGMNGAAPAGLRHSCGFNGAAPARARNGILVALHVRGIASTGPRPRGRHGNEIFPNPIDFRARGLR